MRNVTVSLRDQPPPHLPILGVSWPSRVRYVQIALLEYLLGRKDHGHDPFCLLPSRSPLTGRKGVILDPDIRYKSFRGWSARLERMKEKKKKKIEWTESIDCDHALGVESNIDSGVLSSLIAFHGFPIQPVVGTDTNIILSILAADGCISSRRIILSLHRCGSRCACCGRS
ncbi:hypothetical protein BDV26DRAFT_93333 [Aspergillus bertholletiae]|uniref:Uncharacterized protein n=1 Tax=Aspergillus bertholletiae TaxID=1226010 RepID=A0A5N7BPA8_9EURO|nr:hypothetical protein BDV26DRAFT_93333 [Aspergillus bertholletiae]